MEAATEEFCPQPSWSHPATETISGYSAEGLPSAEIVGLLGLQPQLLSTLFGPQGGVSYEDMDQMRADNCSAET